MDTIWKPVSGFEGYEVSNTGIIRSVRFNKVRNLVYSTGEDGRKTVTFSVKCKPHKFYVHRIVASEFLPADDTRYAVDHIDRDPSNNHISNLRWATRSENQANRPGTSVTGYKGVHHSGERFYAKIYHQNKFIYLGTFESAELAHQAYRAKAKELFGDYVCFDHRNGFPSYAPISAVYSPETAPADEFVNRVSLDAPVLPVRIPEDAHDGLTLSWS